MIFLQYHPKECVGRTREICAVRELELFKIYWSVLSYVTIGLFAINVSLGEYVVTKTLPKVNPPLKNIRCILWKVKPLGV